MSGIPTSIDPIRAPAPFRIIKGGSDVARTTLNAGISLPIETNEYLDTAAKVLKMSKSAIVQDALKKNEIDLRRTLMINLHRVDIINDVPIQLIVPQTAWMQLVTPTLASGILSMNNINQLKAHELKLALLAFWDLWPTYGDFLAWRRNTPTSEYLPTFAMQIGVEALGSVGRRFGAVAYIAESLSGKEPMSHDDVLAITSVGEFTADSYSIFYLKDYTIDTKFPILKSYLDRVK